MFLAFRPHLVAIRRAFNMEIWTDHKVEAGTHWELEIDNAIKAAEVFILLITPDFIASDYVYETELPAIKAQRLRVGGLVIPVVFKRCTWQMIAGSLEATPTDNRRVRPVEDWKPRHHGYDRAREEIMTSIERHFNVSRKEIDWK